MDLFSPSSTETVRKFFSLVGDPTTDLTQTTWLYSRQSLVKNHDWVQLISQNFARFILEEHFFKVPRKNTIWERNFSLYEYHAFIPRCFDVITMII